MGDVSHLDDSPISLMTSSSLDWLQGLVALATIDRRRFRPNILVGSTKPAGLVEQGWTGRRLRIGGVTYSITDEALRCVMITSAQGGLELAPGIARELDKHDDSSGDPFLAPSHFFNGRP